METRPDQSGRGGEPEETWLLPGGKPQPEISPDAAQKAGAFIVGTGSSQYPNQINNVLVFPGLFRGAIDAKATKVNQEMLKAASLAIASCVSSAELDEEHILPLATDKRAHEAVATAVKKRRSIPKSSAVNSFSSLASLSCGVTLFLV